MSTHLPPIRCAWDGKSFVPEKRFALICDRRFVIGDVYPLVVEEPRSEASHRHFFAAVNDAWSNLPELEAERFPTAEHLRKYALIRAGYRDERSIVAASKAEAQRIAAFIRPLDDFAVVAVSECVVRVYTAQSQSARAMGRKEFQESKDKVLGVLAEMIGVSGGELRHEAGRAA